MTESLNFWGRTTATRQLSCPIFKKDLASSYPRKSSWTLALTRSRTKWQDFWLGWAFPMPCTSTSSRTPKQACCSSRLNEWYTILRFGLECRCSPAGSVIVSANPAQTSMQISCDYWLEYLDLRLFVATSDPWQTIDSSFWASRWLLAWGKLWHRNCFWLTMRMTKSWKSRTSSSFSTMRSNSTQIMRLVNHISFRSTSLFCCSWS